MLPPPQFLALCLPTFHRELHRDRHGRFEQEQERMNEAVRVEENLRNMLTDVDQRMNRQELHSCPLSHLTAPTGGTVSPSAASPIRSAVCLVLPPFLSRLDLPPFPCCSSVIASSPFALISSPPHSSIPSFAVLSVTCSPSLLSSSSSECLVGACGGARGRDRGSILPGIELERE